MERLLNQDIWSTPELEEARLASCLGELNWEEGNRPVDVTEIVLHALTWWNADYEYAKECGQHTAECIAMHKMMAISDLLAVINTGRAKGAIKFDHS